MTRVKICGITRLEDALFAEESGADALGFIFYKKSKRYIEPERAREIIAQLNPFIARVGVFVNENVKIINEVAAQCALTHIQLHGDELPEIVPEIDKVVIKALNFSDKLAEEVSIWKDFNLMIDSGDRQTPGGTGKTLPWHELKDLKINRPYILAGGLNLQNIEQSLEILRPIAVDVSSGVETAPGIKDHRKVSQFIKKVKGYI